MLVVDEANTATLVLNLLAFEVGDTPALLRARDPHGRRAALAAAKCNEVLLDNLACVVHAIEKYGIGISCPLGFEPEAG